jgi:hypothetical protein
MNIQVEKALIIKQFKQIDDIDLIKVIKNMLDYALKRDEEIYNIPSQHQDLVMERFHNVRNNPDCLLDWDDVKKSLNPN